MMDDRAQSIGIGRYILAIGVGVIMYWVVDEITSPLFEYAGNSAPANDEVATNGTAWLGEAINFMPATVLFVSFFGIIAYAVFSRQVGPT